MSRLLEISRMGLQPLIILDVKSSRNIKNGFKPFDYCGCYKPTKNKNWIRPSDECEKWMSSLQHR